MLKSNKTAGGLCEALQKEMEDKASRISIYLAAYNSVQNRCYAVAC